MAIGRTVVYSARAAHALSAGIKCRHCSCLPLEKASSAAEGLAAILFIDQKQAFIGRHYFLV